MKKISCVILIVLSTVFSFGCQHDPASGKVTGTVTLDGKPLGEAMVCFYPQPHGAASVGLTDAYGRYELYFSETRKGAETGTHRVTVSTARPQRRVPSTQEIKPASKETVPKPFFDRRNSPLEFDVKVGRQKIDIEISTK